MSVEDRRVVADWFILDGGCEGQYRAVRGAGPVDLWLERHGADRLGIDGWHAVPDAHMAAVLGALAIHLIDQLSDPMLEGPIPPIDLEQGAPE